MVLQVVRMVFNNCSDQIMPLSIRSMRLVKKNRGAQRSSDLQHVPICKSAILLELPLHTIAGQTYIPDIVWVSLQGN